MRQYCFYIFSMLLFSVQGKAQEAEKLFHDAGIYSSIEWSNEEKPTIIPQAWIYIKDYYLETRYNYESGKTVSLYFGRSLLFGEKIETEFIPMIGVVYGQIKGISPGFNLKIDYKRFSSSTQCQYTFDLTDVNNNFFWDWSNFYMKIDENIALGCAIQIFNAKSGYKYYNVSPAFKFEYGSFMFEANAFNLWGESPIWSLGFEYDIK